MLRTRRLLHYLRGTSDCVLRFTGHRIDGEHVEDVNVYNYANWSADAGRKSTTADACFFAGTIIATWPRTQPTLRCRRLKQHYLR
eukprot:14358267-Heterocapsa_arctica.AAC.1